MSIIKEIRERRGWSQTELAAKVGVGARYIAFIESGDRTPSLSLATKLAETLGTSMDTLFLPSKCTNCTASEHSEDSGMI